MKVEVIHYRDPDSSCDMTVFIDGVSVPFREVSVDPGAGWDREDWAEHREASLRDLTPEVREIAEAAFDAGSESEFVEG